MPRKKISESTLIGHANHLHSPDDMASLAVKLLEPTNDNLKPFVVIRDDTDAIVISSINGQISASVRIARQKSSSNFKVASTPEMRFLLTSIRGTEANSLTRIPVEMISNNPEVKRKFRSGLEAADW